MWKSILKLHICVEIEVKLNELESGFCDGAFDAAGACEV